MFTLRKLRDSIFSKGKCNGGSGCALYRLSATLMVLILGSHVVHAGEATGRIYYYRNSPEQFRKRLTWISETTFEEHTQTLRDQRRISNDATDVFLDVLEGNAPDIAKRVAPESAFAKKQDEMQKRYGWTKWLNPEKAIKDKLVRSAGQYVATQIANTDIYKGFRRLPKAEGDTKWTLMPIEDLPKDELEANKQRFAALAEFNTSIESRIQKAHPKSRFLEAHSAVAFRESDKVFVLIGSALWSHPLYAEGYTEFHVFVSAVTGQYISERYAFSNWPLDPGEWQQFKDMAGTLFTFFKLSHSIR